MQVCLHLPPALPARPSYGPAQLNHIHSSLPISVATRRCIEQIDGSLKGSLFQNNNLPEGRGFNTSRRMHLRDLYELILVFYPQYITAAHVWTV